MTTRYVSTTGTDSVSSGSSSSPYLTIGYAVAQAVAGDTINVAAGIYTGTLSINKGIKLIGANKSTTFIRPSSNNANTIFLGALGTPTGGALFSTGFELANFTVEGSMAQSATGDKKIIDIRASGTITNRISIHDNNFIGNYTNVGGNTFGNGISISAAQIGSGGPWVGDYVDIENNTFTGFQVNHVIVPSQWKGGVIRNNSISNSSVGISLNASDPSRYSGILIENNTFSNLSLYGIRFSHNLSNLTVTNNEFDTMVSAFYLFERTSGVTTLGLNNVTITNNICKNNTGNDFHIVPAASPTKFATWSGQFSSFSDNAFTSTSAINNGIVVGSNGIVTPVTFIARNMWFGSSSNPASKIVGNVDYTPWLLSGDSDLSTVGFQAATAPSITSITGGGTVTAGSSTTFSVVASGTTPLSYQWAKGGVNISGATSSSYTIASTVSGDAGSYSVTVTNSVGSATSSSVSLMVNNIIAVSGNNASNQTTFNLGISQLIGGGSVSGDISVKKFASNVSSAETTATINSATNRLVLVNSASLPYQKILSVFPNTWRATIDGKSSPISFTVKFIDESDLTQLVSNPGTQNYTIELPELANRQYVNIYKENADDTTTLVTQASLVSGQTYIYSFNLETNSVYTVADSGVMVLGPGVGSDPHITTMSGEHRIMNKIRGKNRTINILSDDEISVKGHVQGYKLGDYLSHVRITKSGRDICEIDFNRKKINIKDSTTIETVNKVDSSNLTNSVNSNKLRQMFLLKGLNPGGVYMYVDFNQRYICPVFNQAIQNKNLSGLLV